MIESGSISSEAAVVMLQKLIGIEQRSDFADLNLDKTIDQQTHHNALIMSEYAEEALNQIKCQLGYLPRRQVTLPSEQAIRQLLYEYDHDHGDIDKLFESCDPYIDEIYIRDMQPHSIDDYPKEIYHLYDTLYSGLKNAARVRVAKFAKYEPPLKWSIYAELLIRCQMVSENILVSKKKKSSDYETQGIIWFRMNL